MEAVLMNIAPQLITVASLVLIGLGTWAVAILKNKVKAETGRAALDEVDRVINTVVGNLSQTIVEEMKAAAADGHLTIEEKAKIKQMAMRDAKHLLSTHTTEAASKILTDLSDYLSRKIEEQVLAQKKAA